MKLQYPKDMGQVTGMCCRQSPFWGAVGGLILCAAFIGAAFLFWHLGSFWLIWGGCAALAALFVPLIIADVLARFRSTNWLLWLTPDGLSINLRTYQNRHLAEAATVARLPYGEIIRANRHIETWTTPTPRSTRGGTSTYWTEQSLHLHVAAETARQIARALAEERGSEAPKQAGGVRIKGLQQSVTVPAEGIVRIAWRGNNHAVVPALQRVLDELNRNHIELAESTRTDRPNWQKADEAELDELIAQLVRSGDRLAAGEILVRRRGLSSTEAHKLVEKLNSEV